MRPADETAPQGHRRDVDFRDPQGVQPQEHAGHVHDGIHAPQFVQVNLVDRQPVDSGFHRAHAPEDGQRPFLHGGGQVALGDETFDFGQVPLGDRIRDKNIHFGGGKAVFPHAADVQFKARQVQRGEVRPQAVGGQPGVNQRAEQHVTGGTGDEVEVGEGHGSGESSVVSREWGGVSCWFLR